MHKLFCYVSSSSSIN